MKSVAGVAVVVSCLLPLAACGGPAAPMATGPSPPSRTVAGRVTDRLTKTPIDGSMITFAGASTYSTGVSGGRFELEIPLGQYAVSIEGPSHVPHQTQIAYVDGGVELSFSVLRWGYSLFGATYDETFHRVFQQMARIGSSGTTGIRKWVLPPSEIYLVENTVPIAQFESVLDVLREISRTSLPELWCNFTTSIAVVTGPDPDERDGRVIVRPNWDITATGTTGQGAKRNGVVQVNVFRSRDGRLQTRNELTATLLHEFFHVAFAFHVCGGELGPNPFGFGPENCPYPDSLMANRGERLIRPSAQDRLAACIVYHGDTHVGNQFPDINDRYTIQQ